MTTPGHALHNRSLLVGDDFHWVETPAKVLRIGRVSVAYWGLLGFFHVETLKRHLSSGLRTASRNRPVGY
jgi:hypothetical protein